MSKVKFVGWAYPTSDFAKDRGMYKTGCWYLAVYDAGKIATKHDIIYSCLNKTDIIDGANNLVSDSIPFDQYSMHGV